MVHRREPRRVQTVAGTAVHQSGHRRRAMRPADDGLIRSQPSRRRVAPCAVPVVVLVLISACGSSPPTPKATPIAEWSCQEAEAQLDRLLENMLIQLGVGPQFTSRILATDAELVALFDEVDQRTPAVRKRYPRLQVLWDRAHGALQHYMSWKQYKQGRSQDEAISQANAGIALSGQRMVCEPS